MKVTIMTSLFAKWNMDVNTRHNLRITKTNNESKKAKSQSHIKKH